jgi:hypothetical protein
MFPLLVWVAERGKRITYGQMDAELQRRGWGHHVFGPNYGIPAGAIGTALLELQAATDEYGTIPPLNTLLVNADTKVPGNGCDYYLQKFQQKTVRPRLTSQQRKAMAEEVMEEVWHFSKWRQILKVYGFSPLKGGIPALETTALKAKLNKKGWSTEAESEEHRLLKEWVAKNPKILRTNIKFGPGETEWIFASADRADVFFADSLGCVAVEVKAINANDADLERGIYQCVKYRALLRAELKAQGKIPNGAAILVSERQLPLKLRNLAELLQVQTIIVSPLRK